jgi:hypothetical protein
VPGGLRFSNVIISPTGGGTALSLSNQTECFFESIWFSGVASTSIDLYRVNQVSFVGLRLGEADVSVKLRDDVNRPTHDIRYIGSTFAHGVGKIILQDTRSNADSNNISLIGNTYSSGTFGGVFNDGEVIPQSLVIKSTSSDSVLSIEDLSGNAVFEVGADGRATTSSNVYFGDSGSLDFSTYNISGNNSAGAFDFVSKTAMRFWLDSNGDEASAAFRVFDSGSNQLFYLLESGISYFSGNVGIGTTSPATKLDVYNSTATSSTYIYSGGAGLGGRLILEDSDGAGCSSLTTLDGVLTVAVVACP